MSASGCAIVIFFVVVGFLFGFGVGDAHGEERGRRLEREQREMEVDRE